MSESESGAESGSESGPLFRTRADLLTDLRALGLRRGDDVLVHASLRRVGTMIDGPDTLIGALLDAVSPGGTVLAYTAWDAPYEELLDIEGLVPRRWRKHVPPFDARSSRAMRTHGTFPEFLRTRPDAHRSGSPRASVAAVGARAGWFTADHPVNYGFGPGSPYAKLVEAGGKVAMLGAPLDTMTLLLHAEHLAEVEHKEVVRYEVPFATPAGTVWGYVEEFDTGMPLIGMFDRNTYATLVGDFLEDGGGRTGFVGGALSFVVEADRMCSFAVRWIEDADAAIENPDQD